MTEARDDVFPRVSFGLAELLLELGCGVECILSCPSGTISVSCQFHAMLCAEELCVGNEKRKRKRKVPLLVA